MAVTRIEISFLVYCCYIITKNVTAATCTWFLGGSRRVWRYQRGNQNPANQRIDNTMAHIKLKME